LWESWHPKDAAASTDVQKEEPLRTFTIITTEANQRLQELHNRMPVIIAADKREEWLNPDANPENLKNMLQPLASSEIEFHEVSRTVNSPQNNSPQCIEPVNSGLS
jgi:putative SOS response-associated peptidase YedK